LAWKTSEQLLCGINYVQIGNFFAEDSTFLSNLLVPTSCGTDTGLSFQGRIRNPLTE